MNKRIYIKDWMQFKPYEEQSKTDHYYLKLSNNVKKAITSNKQSFVLQSYLDEAEVNQLACFLTSYFEDLISETNIWNSFIRVHKRFYKKQLPFYVVDQYYEKEINIQDVCFIIWYFLNTIQKEKFIAPIHDFIIDIGEKVMDVFDEAWEYAPENEFLKSYYKIDENEDDYYIARKLIDNILFDSYLFLTDTFFELKEKEFEILNKNSNEDGEKIMILLNDNRDALLQNSNTHLLSLSGKEWGSEIIGKNHPLCSHFLNISKKISDFFLYKGQDQNNVLLEHIASSKPFKITKTSFEDSSIYQEIDTMIYMGIVRWKDEWWFSGVQFQCPFDADLVLDKKNSIQSRATVNFLDPHEKKINEMLEKQLKAFKDFNNSSQIAFMPSDKIDDFYKAYFKFFNNTLGFSKKETEEVNDRNHFEAGETGLVFFNPKSGVEIAINVNAAFPLSNNPYYQEESSKNDIMNLFMDKSISTELAMYCVDNCKKDLPFFNEGIGELCLKDIDFLLRFWKKENYHTTPQVTLTGQNKS